MRSRTTLIALLVILVSGLALIMNKMETAKNPPPPPPPPPPKARSIRARDLARLCDPKGCNWKLDSKVKVVKTESGLKYQDIQVGSGRMPQPGDTVIVDYVGWTAGGRRFDTSLAEGRDPLAFHIGKGEVVKGWDEGIATMREGGVRRLYIPSNLGYGVIGNPPTIEPNATLVFMTRLVAVEPGGGK